MGFFPQAREHGGDTIDGVSWLARAILEIAHCEVGSENKGADVDEIKRLVGIFRKVG